MAASAGGGEYADEVKPLDRIQGIVRTPEEQAGPPRSDGGNAAINKSAGACGGLWLLTCATNQLFSLCSDTHVTLRSSDHSDNELAHSSSEKTKPFILLRTACQTSSKALPLSTVGWGGLRLTFKQSCLQFAQTGVLQNRHHSAVQRHATLLVKGPQEAKSPSMLETGTMGVCTRRTWIQEEVQKGQVVE